MKKQLESFDCPYASKKQKKYSKKEKTFAQQQAIWDRVRSPIGKAFNLHENVVKASKITDVRSFVDVLIAKQFEGLPMNYEFTKNNQKDLLEYSMHMLTRPVAYEPKI